LKRLYFFSPACLYALLLLPLLMLLSPLVQAQSAEPLLITRGTDRATPIAVVPFGWQGDNLPPGDMAQIVETDLYHSGLFAPIERQNMISQPAHASEIIFRDFQALSAQYLLIGNVVASGGRLDVQFALFNVSTEQQLLSGRTSGTVAQLRDMAHYIADEAYQNLTGNKGAFSTRLLYVTAEQSAGNSRYRLYRSDYDGARAAVLLESSSPILSPRYSPDGRQVAYVSFENRRPRIFIQQLASGQRAQVTDFEGLNGAPAFSPDGRQLALVLSRDGNPEIYLMNLASRALQRVTNHIGIDTEPFWGANGRTLYFTSDRSGKPQIYKTDVSGGREAQRVTFEGNYNANPKLSADEKTLVMVHRQQGYTGFKIAAQDLEKGTVRILSETSLDDSPTVAPNGSMLIYATRQQGQGVLMLVSINGRVRVPLPTAAGDVREPSWSPWLD